jgi:L-lactate dehydrogenase complex protein LldF
MAQEASFKSAIATALADARLQGALAEVPLGFVAARARAKAALPEFEALRRRARDLKDHTLANLDLYLEEFEANARKAGTHVHWASTGSQACEIILGICRASAARLILKSKSMVAEEIGLNRRLEAAALQVVETDLGEYAIQLRGETPSHIIAPAIHLTPADIEADFRRRHRDLPGERDLSRPEALVAEARSVLREKFLAADVGITGANLLVAATGSAVIVTNEGNADLTLSLPRVHIVLASIEKVVPTLPDAFTLLRLLARSGTGQDFTAYTTFVTGPAREGDCDGARECHVVLLDNGRSALLSTPMREVLRCIRCGACMNHCPVYCSIGGHAYGAVYPGPIGAALMPSLTPPSEAAHAGELAGASTFCGRCDSVCPVEIPLVDIMRRRRDAAFADASFKKRTLMRAWAALAVRPRAYHLLAQIGMGLLRLVAPRRGAFSRLPFAGAWTRTRDFPAPQGPTFQQLWAKRQQGGQS